MKKLLSSLICLLMIVGLFPAAHAAVPKVQDLTLTGLDYAVGYSFRAGEEEYVYIKFKTPEQVGAFMAQGENGLFTGVLDLPLTYPGSSVSITVCSSSMTEIVTEKVTTKLKEGTGEKGVPAADGPLHGITVCIDPGHQANFVAGTEDLGPGLKGTVTNTPGSALGVLTKRREHIVTLEIGLLLKEMLLTQGADVVMTRETADTWLTNQDRCDIANECSADIYLRLHCNSNDSDSATGIWIYAPKNSDYAKALTNQETYLAWGETLCGAMKEATGVTRGGAQLTDRYVGNNWTVMPTFLVEMGYMSTPKDDILLSTPSYQKKLCEGMIQGITEICRMRGLLP